jgi:hypothetical protein
MTSAAARPPWHIVVMRSGLFGSPASFAADSACLYGAASAAMTSAKGAVESDTKTVQVTTPLRRNLLQQRFLLLKIARVEPFGVPAAHRSEQFALAAPCPGRAQGVLGSW